MWKFSVFLQCKFLVLYETIFFGHFVLETVIKNSVMIEHCVAINLKTEL